jgi:hypothetical protein
MSRRLLGACLATMLAAGCYAKEMVLVDPRLDLETLVGRKVLIVPVHSQVPVPSDVPALATAALAEHLGKVSGLEVLTANASETASIAQAEPQPAAVAQLAEDCKVDVVVTASIAEFWERQLRDFAQRHSVFALDALAPNSTWRDRPRAEVVMRVAVRFFAGASGKLLWAREALGGDSEEAPMAETGDVSNRLHRQVSQQIGSQIIGDLYPYFTYQDVKPKP